MIGGSLALAACGSGAAGAGSTPSQNPQQVLLSAAHTATTHSVRLDMTIGEHLTANGPRASSLGGASGTTISVTGHMDIANASRMSGHLTVDAAGRHSPVALVLYDGTAYVSVDGGKTYRSLPAASNVNKQYGPESALQYLDAIGSVKDIGPTSVSGTPAEEYEAQLDPDKMASLLRSYLSSIGNGAQSNILRALRFDGGTLDAAVDHQDRLLTENGSFTASIDLGKVQASFQGTVMHISITITSHFYDYGAAITVTRPANVNG